MATLICVRFIRIPALLACLSFAGTAPGQEPPDPPAAPRPEAAPDGEPWLGVWLGDAVDGGAQILALVPGGPAHRAGLRIGDVVIEAASLAIVGEAGLARAIRTQTPGERLLVRVVRGGDPVEVDVEVGQRNERPSALALPLVPLAPEVPPSPEFALDPGYLAYPARLSLERAGLQLTEITPALRTHYGAPPQAGVLVTRVEPGRLAAEAGFEVGDVLVRLGEEEIRTEMQVRVNLVRWDVRRPLQAQVIRSRAPVAITVSVERPEPGLTVPEDPGPSGATTLLRRRIELEIQRLERRLSELKRELDELDAPR